MHRGLRRYATIAEVTSPRYGYRFEQRAAHVGQYELGLSDFRGTDHANTHYLFAPDLETARALVRRFLRIEEGK